MDIVLEEFEGGRCWRRGHQVPLEGGGGGREGEGETGGEYGDVGGDVGGEARDVRG